MTASFPRFTQTKPAGRQHGRPAPPLLAVLPSQTPELCQVRTSALETLAIEHSLPADLFQQQADIIRALIQSIHDRPRSYTNVMSLAGTVLRAGLWLAMDVSTQADFCRAFGAERHLRPNKSVAWAIYHRIFPTARLTQDVSPPKEKHHAASS